jgi:hypothetical protein
MTVRLLTNLGGANNLSVELLSANQSVQIPVSEALSSAEMLPAEAIRLD